MADQLKERSARINKKLNLTEMDHEKPISNDTNGVSNLNQLDISAHKDRGLIPIGERDEIRKASIDRVKNVLAKVSKNYFFEMEFKVNEQTMDIFRSMRNIANNEFMGNIVEEIMDNSIFKIICFSVTGLSQKLNTKQMTVLNKKWNMPVQLEYGDGFSANFYDMIIQYRDNKGELVSKYFNLSQFFKIWMENLFILDSSGKPITTRTRYFRDFVIPQVKIYQYFPAQGVYRTDKKEKVFKTKIGFENNPQEQTLIRPEFVENWQGAFTITPEDVKDAHEELFSDNKTLKGFTTVFKHALHAILKFGSLFTLVHAIGGYALNLATDEHYDKGLFKDMMEEYVKSYHGFLKENDPSQRFFTAIWDEDKNLRDNYKDVKNMSIDDFIEFALNDKEISKILQETLSNPIVLEQIEKTHKDLGIKYSVLDENILTNKNKDELKAVLSMMYKSDLLETVGENKERAFEIQKIKTLLQSLQNRLSTVVPEGSISNGTAPVTDGLVTGSVDYDLLTKNRLQNLSYVFRKTFYEKQEDAFYSWHLGAKHDYKGVSPDGFVDTDTVEEQNKSQVEHSKVIAWSNGTSEVMNKVNGLMEYITVVLGAVTAFYSIKDLVKTMTMPWFYFDANINGSLEKSHHINWHKAIYSSATTAADAVPPVPGASDAASDVASAITKKNFGYAEVFYKELITKLLETGERASNEMDKAEAEASGSTFNYLDYVNHAESIEGIVNPFIRTIVKEGSNDKAENFGLVATKTFTLYNVWPTSLSFDDMSFDNEKELTKFRVKFGFTHLDEE